MYMVKENSNLLVQLKLKEINFLLEILSSKENKSLNYFNHDIDHLERFYDKISIKINDNKDLTHGFASIRIYFQAYYIKEKESKSGYKYRTFKTKDVYEIGVIELKELARCDYISVKRKDYSKEEFIQKLETISLLDLQYLKRHFSNESN